MSKDCVCCTAPNHTGTPYCPDCNENGPDSSGGCDLFDSWHCWCGHSCDGTGCEDHADVSV